MTRIESLMLYATFGGFAGLLLSLWFFIIKEWIKDRKEKKEKKEQQ
ncbi:hypothetical protein [Streptococcus anginosus]|nr:hypothetical protein [Streptococcus anginosus]